MKPKAPNKPAAKKKAKKVKQPPTIQRIHAPHTFTQDERNVLGDNLRGALDEIEALEGQAKSAAADYKLRIQNHKNDVKMLRNKLGSNQEDREVEAIVEFDAKNRQKTFIHPVSKEKIRTENMTDADFQLPLFKPAADGKEKPAAKGETDVQTLTKAPDKKGKAKKAGEPGKTNVGDVLDKASALTDAPKVPFDVDADRDHAKLTRDFKRAANKAGWTDVQISTIHALLRDCDTESGMRDVLRPHVTELPAESEGK